MKTLADDLKKARKLADATSDAHLKAEAELYLLKIDKRPKPDDAELLAAEKEERDTRHAAMLAAKRYRQMLDLLVVQETKAGGI